MTVRLTSFVYIFANRKKAIFHTFLACDQHKKPHSNLLSRLQRECPVQRQYFIGLGGGQVVFSLQVRSRDHRAHCH